MPKSTRDGGLRPLFRRHLQDLFWVPIETWGVSTGVSDSWYISHATGASGWVEYKREDRPLEPEQAAFLDRVWRCGYRSWIAVVSKDDDCLRFYRGGDAMKLAPRRWTAAVPAGQWYGGHIRWDWGMVKIILTGPRNVA